MRQLLRSLAIGTLMFIAVLLVAQGPFDGDWLGTVTCPGKGKIEGYRWQFPATIQNSHLHGEHGAAGQLGYLVIEGDIAADGSASLSANEIAASEKNPRGEQLSYKIGAQFRAAEGSGSQSEPLGFMRHPCRVEFAKQQPTGQTSE